MIVNLDFSGWHFVQALLNNSQTLTHFFHTDQVSDKYKQSLILGSDGISQNYQSLYYSGDSIATVHIMLKKVNKINDTRATVDNTYVYYAVGDEIN